jgi:hypothetical protein
MSLFTHSNVKENDMPEDLEALVDKLRTMQQQRISAQKILDNQQEEERTLMEHIRVQMIDQGLDELSGDVGTVSISVRDNPDVEDWDDLYAFMLKTGNFQLMQKRLAVGGVREIWEVGDEVPGVTHNIEKVLVLKGVKK